MYVCMYVCMYVRIYVYIYIYIYMRRAKEATPSRGWLQSHQSGKPGFNLTCGYHTTDDCSINPIPPKFKHPEIMV